MECRSIYNCLTVLQWKEHFKYITVDAIKQYISDKKNRKS